MLIKCVLNVTFEDIIVADFVDFVQNSK